MSAFDQIHKWFLNSRIADYIGLVSGKVTSLRKLYSNVEEFYSATNITRMVANLMRTGIALIMASTLLGSMILVLFAPTLPFLPISGMERVGAGFLSSYISYRLYKAFRISNIALLQMGQVTGGMENQPWSGKLIILFLSLVLIVLSPIIGALSVKKVDELIIQGLLSDAGFLLKLSVLSTIVIYGIGITILFTGASLMIIAVLTPYRAFLFVLYRIFKRNIFTSVSNAFEYISGVSLYTEPDIVCEKCFTSNFIFEQLKYDNELYVAICANCSKTYAITHIPTDKTSDK